MPFFPDHTPAANDENGWKDISTHPQDDVPVMVYSPEKRQQLLAVWDIHHLAYRLDGTMTFLFDENQPSLWRSVEAV